MTALTALTSLLLVAVLAGGLGFVLGSRRTPEATAQDLDVATSATFRAVEPVRESLDRVDQRLRELEASRIEWHTQLREQVEAMRLTGEELRRETSSLATALRRPEVRGRWGELHLRRTAELAGMVEHCDFDLQVTTADGRLRPDMVVRLVGGRQIVVDSKVPLDAFLEATGSEDADRREAALGRHAHQLRQHIDHLAAKSYWRQFETTPQFVVLFVPGESFLSAALQTDPGLLEHAAAQNVVLASPTTLVALLRTVALGWTEASLAENAREIHRVASELYERLGTVMEKFDGVGQSLERAVKAYNGTIGSVESRLLVSARRMHQLKVAPEPPFQPRIVESTPRVMTAPELRDELTS